MDGEGGGRDKAPCERLIKRLTRWRTRLDGADEYAVDDGLLPIGQLYPGKETRRTASSGTTPGSGIG